MLLNRFSGVCRTDFILKSFVDVTLVPFTNQCYIFRDFYCIQFWGIIAH
jgi:hypothetical protein